MTHTGYSLAQFKERFRQVAAERDASQAVVESYLSTLRPRVALHTEANDAGVVFRYGGDPRLPAEIEWPGELAFLGALDCSAIPREHLDLPYPTGGELLFFWDGWDTPDTDEGRVIHVADPAAAAPRSGPGDAYERIDYYATPRIEAAWDSSYFPDDEFEDFRRLHDAVQQEESPVHDVFALGGYPNGEMTPEWEMAEVLGQGQTFEQKQEIEARLHNECRVLLSANSDPAEEYRLTYAILTQDLSAGRLDAVRVSANVND
ncbi:DUF1963 domain-containing protein [Kineosporia babensis]|uniref:DUF1963 domain-containing protein n=1 Tax=Kineosporia babensis TaxID=499548 RepID=A0A9X1NG91_9ACTN|nr:DUF1963 domain-containing protein [Kineosporia babensis]MCD5314422.1 DUF1963 domain-containing protein [Kineosporia babensis]